MNHKKVTNGLRMSLGLLISLLLGGNSYATGGITPPTDGGSGGTGQDELDAAYNEGYDDGYTQGFSEGYDTGFGEGEAQGYAEGFVDGTEAGKATCLVTPDACGIDLFTFLGDSTFGETEPNNHILSADALVLGQNYHGNNYSKTDLDWFWVETTEPNQNINIGFSGLIEDVAQDGWLISVRDSAGNIIATFDSNVEAPSDPSNVQARTFVVTAAAVGVYFITVEPLFAGPDQDGFHNAYNIVGNLTNTGMDDPSFQGNFENNEVEPNNTQGQANVLESRVTMHGYIDKTFSLVGTTGAFNYDSDMFYYDSLGDEEFSIQVCVLFDCGSKLFRVKVEHQGGAVLVNGPVGHGETLNIGLGQPGRYYVTFGPMESGEVVEARDEDDNLIAVLPVVFDIGGPYNFTVAGTTLPVNNKGIALPIPGLTQLNP